MFQFEVSISQNMILHIFLKGILIPLSITKVFCQIVLSRCYFLKTLCACCNSGHREPSPNVRHHRTVREGEGRTPSGHKGCLWSIKGRLFPLHLVSVRETLLPKAQLRWVHLYYLERTWSHCPHHLTGSLKWRQTSHNTQNDPPTPTGPVFRLRRDGSGSCSVDRGWGSRGCKRPSCHFGELPL